MQHEHMRSPRIFLGHKGDALGARRSVGTYPPVRTSPKPGVLSKKPGPISARQSGRPPEELLRPLAQKRARGAREDHVHSACGRRLTSLRQGGCSEANRRVGTLLKMGAASEESWSVFSRPFARVHDGCGAQFESQGFFVLAFASSEPMLLTSAGRQ